MKRIMKYLTGFGSAIFVLTGCENPEIDNSLPYYYTETIVYLPDAGTQNINIRHTPTTVRGETIEFSVARHNNDPELLEKALKKPCTVELEAAFEGIEEQYIAFRDGLTLTIPAGETSVSSFIDIDWAFAAETTAEAEYTITLSIKSSSAYISEERNKTIYEISKNEKPESNLYTDAPAGTNVDRSGWMVQISTDSDLNNWNDITQLTDGDNYTYQYVYSFLAVKVDMGSVQNLTGVVSYCSYGSYYAPNKFIVETSQDGSTWDKVGGETSVTQDYYLYASFYDPIEARYFRLQMFGNNVLSSEIYAYTE